MAKGKPAPGSRPDWIGRMMFQGWTSIAVWMAFGLLLEGFLGFKSPAYLDDQQRRELFRLAHTHGTLLGVVLIVAALCGRRGAAVPPRSARAALRAGSLVMPVGFLLAGVWHPEGDPGLAIWLVPPGALLVIFGAIVMAMASAKPSSDNQNT
jgi:hypothetical protein